VLRKFFSAALFFLCEKQRNEKGKKNINRKKELNKGQKSLLNQPFI